MSSDVEGSLPKAFSSRSRRLRRLDRVIAELNAVLAILAIGLAVLDLTVAIGE
jgi:hypothetical protein